MPGLSWYEKKGDHVEGRSQQMDLPADLSNGLIPLVVASLPRKENKLQVSYLVCDPGPRVVKFTISRDGEEKFHIQGTSRYADRLLVHTEIGGLAGAIAPLLGEQPPDMKVWITTGDAPTFLKFSGPLYTRGPVWTMSLAVPEWIGNR